VALANVVADIHTQLATIDSALATAQPAALLGSVYLNEQAAPPRVVWVALRGKPGALDPRGTTPRAFGCRYLDVACHIWGADAAATDALLNEVHNAARRSLGAGARWLAEEWPQQTGDEIAECGTLAIVVFEFRIPIVEVQQQAVTVLTAQQTTEMDFPDGTSVSGTPAP
jgi:hypothetical protein